MGCLWCRNFNRTDDYSADKNWAEIKGNCVRQTPWVPVKGGHFCSQLVLDSPGLVVSWRAECDRTFEEVNRYRDRAIKAEKAAKEMRAKLKAMKAGIQSSSADGASNGK